MEEGSLSFSRVVRNAGIKKLPDTHSHRRAPNISLSLVEYLIGLIDQVAHKGRNRTTQLIPVPRHSVALTPQMVSIGQDEALLASGGFNDLIRDRGLKVLNVLLFDFYLGDAWACRFGRLCCWWSEPLPNCRSSCGKRVSVQRVSVPHHGVTLTAACHTSAIVVRVYSSEICELQRDSVWITEAGFIWTFGVYRQVVENSRKVRDGRISGIE